MNELELFSPACASDAPTTETPSGVLVHQREAGDYFTHHQTSPHARCAACLYATGLGAKAVAKTLPISFCAVLRAVKVLGVLDRDRHKFRNSLRSEAAARREKERQSIAMAKREEKKKQRALLEPIKREYAKKKALEYYHRNKEKLLPAMRERQKRRYHQKLRFDTNWTTRRKESLKKWNDNNKERKSQYQRQWIKDNPEKVRANRRLLRSSPKHKLVANLRRRLRDILKQRKGYRFGSSISFVGCTSDQLRRHIEAQWKHGMTWQNYGQWHVDHIIPCAAFDLVNKEQAKVCFHFTNLQPLWAKDNLIKSDTLPNEWQPMIPMAYPPKASIPHTSQVGGIATAVNRD